jgi:hypothetical protein
MRNISLINAHQKHLEARGEDPHMNPHEMKEVSNKHIRNYVID